MNMINTKKQKIKLERRRKRVRSKVEGTKERPRVSVYRSNTGIYVSVNDDKSGKTLFSISSKDLKKGNTLKEAFEVGKLIAQKASEVKIKEVVFDRGGLAYHGKVKAVAEGLREGGLKV